ncbi:MAG: biopolymer transporter ExbD [Bacteroidales bacterium]|nr:biopolymer transporter ExbD [Bacteroidales bacterium]
MAKVKVKRKSTLIDMTAMSDVTVLLLTFFMLTSTFVQQEPQQVVTPASVSEFEIPEQDVLKILIEPSGKVFLGLDNFNDRAAALDEMLKVHSDVKLTDEQKNTFRLSEWFGVPVAQMPEFLSMRFEDQAGELKNYGVPCDSIDNQFKEWVDFATRCGTQRMKEDPAYDELENSQKRLKIIIKADKRTPYDVVKKVMDTLQELRQNRFSLITTLNEG